MSEGSGGAGAHGPESTDGRDETAVERADRNWTELTQELRVSQTGVQILTGFLLILPFQNRFSELSTGQVAIYLILMALAIITTILMVAPVSLHRFLFQRGRKVAIVRIGNRITSVALVTLSLLITGTAWFVFDVVIGGPPALLAPILAVIILALLWLVLPLLARFRD